MSTIAILDKWYSSRCNGVWELKHGVRIDTIAEGGWWIRIDLSASELQTVASLIEPINLSPEESGNSWVFFNVIDDAIIGSCAAGMLDDLLLRVVAILAQIK